MSSSLFPEIHLAVLSFLPFLCFLFPLKYFVTEGEATRTQRLKDVIIFYTLTFIADLLK